MESRTSRIHRVPVLLMRMVKVLQVLEKEKKRSRQLMKGRWPGSWVSGSHGGSNVRSPLIWASANNRSLARQAGPRSTMSAWVRKPSAKNYSSVKTANLKRSLGK